MDQVIEIYSIVAVDADWGIGRNNQMLFSIPEDMKYFMEKTMGSVVVMGRKNLESLPGGKPLAKRRNIILSKTLHYSDDYEVCKTMDEVFGLLKEIKNQKIFCIGGTSVYEAFLPYCSFAYVTKMHKDFYGECFFPNLDTHPDWKVAEQGEVKEYKGVEFQFMCYKNMNKKDYISNFKEKKEK